MRRVAAPPQSRVGKYDRQPPAEHKEIADRLKKNAGVWFLVKTAGSVSAASRFAANIRHGKYLAFRDGDYESRASGVEVYARLKSS